MPSVEPKVVAELAHLLKGYVYVLLDPRDMTPFYVGKGHGTRMLSHGFEAGEIATEQLTGPDEEDRESRSRKVERIRAIRREGSEPVVWILRYGMGTEYTEVEAAAIDLLMSLPVTPRSPFGLSTSPMTMSEQLTNERREANKGSGAVSLSRLIDELASPPLPAETPPLLLITLKPWTTDEQEVPGGGTRTGHGFKQSWLDPDVRAREMVALADSVRCWWKLSDGHVQAAGIEHIVPVYGQVTRGLFAIVPGSWVRSSSGRVGFQVEPVLSGELFDLVVGPHGHRTPAKLRGDQSVMNYWPKNADPAAT